MLLPVPRNFAFFNMLRWQWTSSLSFLGVALGVWLVFYYGHLDLKLPALSVSVLGSALGIFVSFRTNSAYQRWWEGRQLWGRLVNTSRHFVLQVQAYLTGASLEQQTELVERQIGYVHVLRAVLRDQDFQQDADVQRVLGAGLTSLKGRQNACHALIQQQFQALSALREAGRLDAAQMHSFDESLRQFLDIQGGCERIKRTPMPPGYRLLATRLIQAFSLLLPLALVHDIGWRVIPINLLLCVTFTLINEMGRVLEDPFTLYYNGLPLMALSRTIEVNLRQSLGQSDLPEIPGPVPPGVLL
ncbi:MAG: bestrophin family protein [Candidatus Sericytochromatia bacterium]